MTGILFVCSGNTCRSPMAVALFRHLAEEAGLADVEADSAGTRATEGQPASAGTRQALSDCGIELGRHWSKQATAELVCRADLVLTMQASQRDPRHQQFPRHRKKVQTIGEYTGGGEVRDPLRTRSGRVSEVRSDARPSGQAGRRQVGKHGWGEVRSCGADSNGEYHRVEEDGGEDAGRMTKSAMEARRHRDEEEGVAVAGTMVPSVRFAADSRQQSPRP